VVIPTDLLLAAFRQLFPAERMIIMGGRPCRQSVKATSVTDVTEARPSISHVRADRLKLSTALVDLSRSGAHLAIWMHSHPGTGPSATFPSAIDLRQEEDLRRHYSNQLVCVIAVRDGFVRVWGRAVDDGSVVVRWQGQGISSHRGEPNVYQLELH
jgi:proteasome lid subunit RPN8/RPN11